LKKVLYPYTLNIVRKRGADQKTGVNNRGGLKVRRCNG